jgi:hypothetical protein
MRRPISVGFRVSYNQGRDADRSAFAPPSTHPFLDERIPVSGIRDQVSGIRELLILDTCHLASETGW